MTAASVTTDRPPVAGSPGAAGPGGAGGAGRRRSASRWRRRWYRLVVPLGLVAVLIAVTLVARAAEEPDLGDPQTLAPGGTGPDGASELAALLTARGVTIEPVNTYQEALRAVNRSGDAVVFLPKPTVVGAGLLYAGAPVDRRRVVMVAPDNYTLLLAGLPLTSGPRRWAPKAVAPGDGCRIPEATRAGAASVLRNRYFGRVEAGVRICYQGGLARVRAGGPEVFVVGSTDPFRNRRIHEHGNAALALELLGDADRVIWVGALTAEVDLDLPTLRRPPVDRSSGNAFADLIRGYPPGILAGLTLLVILAVLVALARARRLGPPVPEPLPVLVPSVEAVVGRGRLYQLTRGRGVALAALQAAALPKLAAALGLPANPPPTVEVVAEAAARRTGQPVEQVRRTLSGAEPADDQELIRAVAALDALVAAVRRDHPTGRMVS